jgi:hypothetical protein
MPSKFAIPNQIAKSLGAQRLPVKKVTTPPRPPAPQVTVPTPTVPPAQTTIGIEPSVNTGASASTDIPQPGEPVVPTEYPLIAVPPIPGRRGKVRTVPSAQETVPTSGVIVPTTPDGINPSVGRSPESGGGGGGRFEFQEFTAQVF